MQRTRITQPRRLHACPCRLHSAVGAGFPAISRSIATMSSGSEPPHLTPKVRVTRPQANSERKRGATTKNARQRCARRAQTRRSAPRHSNLSRAHNAAVRETAARGVGRNPDRPERLVSPLFAAFRRFAPRRAHPAEADRRSRARDNALTAAEPSGAETRKTREARTRHSSVARRRATRREAAFVGRGPQPTSCAGRATQQLRHHHQRRASAKGPVPQDMQRDIRI